MAAVIEQTAAPKINLNLSVLGRRADGFHIIDSHVAFLDTGDRLSFAAAPELTLEVTGPFAAALGAARDNLVIRAAQALADGVPGIELEYAVTLEKNLPVAAGLGSGSADAAATLRGLLMAHGRTVSTKALSAIAASLGSDVPACLKSRAARVTGTGTIVGPAAPLPECFAVLVNPGVQLATARVYWELGIEPGTDLPEQPMAPAFGGFQTAEDLAAWLVATRNDLEPAAARLCPRIAEMPDVLMAQNGCLCARMSGSGPTCYGLFAKPDEARAAASAIKSAKPDWWTCYGRLA
jgi:4-diphosphocytidyl-2-C-methyl-D-erythritol kinase